MISCDFRDCRNPAAWSFICKNEQGTWHIGLTMCATHYHSVNWKGLDGLTWVNHRRQEVGDLADLDRIIQEKNQADG